MRHETTFGAMTHSEDNAVVLPSCMFARTGDDVAGQGTSSSCLWAREDDSSSSGWEVTSEDPPSSEEKIKGRLGRNAKGKTSSPYKHVPHREKPPQLVARRNARERRRVQAVNVAFSRLRKVVPIENNRGKRVSKVKTLHKAIEYISQLQRLLIEADSANERMPGNPDLNKENNGEPNNRWGICDVSCRQSGGTTPQSLAQLLQDFTDDF